MLQRKHIQYTVKKKQQNICVESADRPGGQTVKIRETSSQQRWKQKTFVSSARAVEEISCDFPKQARCNSKSTAIQNQQTTRISSSLINGRMMKNTLRQANHDKVWKHFRQTNPAPSAASPDWMPPFEQGHEKLASGCIKVLPRQIGEQLGSVITAPRWQVRLSQ